MASTPSINIKIRIDVDGQPFAVQVLTGVLRAFGWKPWKELACGCNPKALCAIHARIRLEEHYR